MVAWNGMLRWFHIAFLGFLAGGQANDLIQAIGFHISPVEIYRQSYGN